MLTVWRSWCRLCAKEDGNEIDVFVKNDNSIDIAQAITKFFLITITPFDETPAMICKCCYHFLSSLVKFTERIQKVDAMFSDIIYENINSVDMTSLRYHYGVTDNEEPVKYLMKMCDQSTDTTDLGLEFIQMTADMMDSVDHSSQDVLSVIVPETDETEMCSIAKKQLVETFKVEQTSDTEEHCITEISPTDSTSMDATNSVDDVGEEIDYLEFFDGKEDEEDEENELNSIDPIITMDSEVQRKENKRRKTETKRQVFVDKLQCEKCLKDFTRKSALRYHMKTHHPPDDKSYACAKCGKQFPTEKRALQHEIVHLPPELKPIYPCRYCDKKFAKSVNVQTHIRSIHIGERPFICEVCGKSFATKGALNEHQYTHVDETPFQCSKCPKKFKNMARLKTHEDTHNDTTYVCPNCGLMLNTKRTLQMHMVVHSDQKKYKCHFCGTEFKRSKALKNHLILHTGLKPYNCPFCDKTFANGSNCRSHKKKAHPVELAAMEAAGKTHRATNIPKLEQLKASVTTTKSESDEQQSQKNVISERSSQIITEAIGVLRHQLQTQNLQPIANGGAIFDGSSWVKNE